MKLLMIAAPLVGLAGGGLLSYGAWLLLPAAGFIVAGGAVSWLVVSGFPPAQPQTR
ncbi:hypothetical protein [Xenorhabdus bakwenae]|uniref:hypothetical protein n=1 Tax=Xenorhabdus bakwenae TaxID=3026967 RepID=UPI003DA11484